MRGNLCQSASDFLLHMAPSLYILQLVSDRSSDCFVPASVKKHIREARQINGAGLRVDAEFKLAKKIRYPQRAQVVLARKWSWTTLINAHVRVVVSQDKIWRH